MSAIRSTSSARKRPLAVEREPRGGDVVAALRVAEEMLAAVGDPLHRPREPLRRQRRPARIRDRRTAWCRSRRRRRASPPASSSGAIFSTSSHRMSRMAWLPWLPSVSVSRSVAGIDLGDDAAGVEIVGDQPLIDDVERDRARGAARRRARSRGHRRAGLEGEIAGLAAATPAQRPGRARLRRRSHAAAAPSRWRSPRPRPWRARW